MPNMHTCALAVAQDGYSCQVHLLYAALALFSWKIAAGQWQTQHTV